MTEATRHRYREIRVDQLVPFARNPRTHSEAQVEQLRASIREFGFTNPLLIDSQGGIVAGHGRLLAAKAEGLESVPAIELHGLTEKQRRALMVADNQHALNSGWDFDLLVESLQEIGADDFSIDALGFTAQQMDQLLPEVQALPELPAGDRAGFQEMTFILADEQVRIVKAALQLARGSDEKDAGSDNRNGNALTTICSSYVKASQQ